MPNAPLFRRVVLWSVAAIGIPPSPAGDDGGYGWLIIFALPVVMAEWAYRKIDDIPRSEKGIYRAHRPADEAGL